VGWLYLTINISGDSVVFYYIWNHSSVKYTYLFDSLHKIFSTPTEINHTPITPFQHFPALPTSKLFRFLRKLFRFLRRLFRFLRRLFSFLRRLFSFLRRLFSFLRRLFSFLRRLFRFSNPNKRLSFLTLNIVPISKDSYVNFFSYFEGNNTRCFFS